MMTEKSNETETLKEETIEDKKADTELALIKKKNPFRKLKKIIKVPHYDVPPCPNCGSIRTGRFVKYHSSDNDDYITKTSLKNGEIIKFVEEVDPDHDLFCSDCGFTWSEYVPVKWISLDDVKTAKYERGTQPILEDMVAEEKEEKKHEKKGIFRSFIKFVGKPF